MVKRVQRTSLTSSLQPTECLQESIYRSLYNSHSRSFCSYRRILHSAAQQTLADDTLVEVSIVLVSSNTSILRNNEDCIPRVNGQNRVSRRAADLSLTRSIVYKPIRYSKARKQIQ